ncbi:hypothetical protein LTR84_005338 [Exophiala bonariae]|uniref:Rhodopsin domain-containing protein n=1 Tax=Exophiala bonariae TaxID=1690606 RepID=A0AAV9N6X1_9EURO|nr:hypothetical protein LTR84_005338 [Exophiala bonariae]
MVTRIPPFKAPFGWDDGLILIVLISMIVMSSSDLVLIHFGFGRDVYSIPPNNITTIRKFFYIGVICYFFSIMVTKLSILAFYLRIFPDRTFIYSTYVLMGLIVACILSFIPAIIWQCTPVSFAWTSLPGQTGGHCINTFLMTWIGSSINVVLDLAVILVPIPHLLKLTLSRKKKIQVVAMFSVGLFVTIVSAVRFHSLVTYRKSTNFTWDYVDSKYMSTLEVDVGIICACMPAMQLLLRKVAPSLFGSSADNKSSYLHPYSNSHARTFRNTNSHNPPSKNITKTISTTITDMPLKDSDSVMELVDNSKPGSANGRSGSNTTLPPDPARDHNW